MAILQSHIKEEFESLLEKAMKNSIMVTIMTLLCY